MIATGKRIQKRIQPNQGAVTTTDYFGEFQYENGVLQFFAHSEGYVKPHNGGYLYVYQYKDHLGNIRLSYADLNQNGSIEPTSEIIDEANYYPFGLQHEGYNMMGNVNSNKAAEKYKFNGIEYEDNLGFGFYEMDLRHYNPSIARWVIQDPVIHYEYSPYNAFDNNPVYWSDPSGADATSIYHNGEEVIITN
ncbi:RHS repeat-associated core domain-containing protein [Capnocytophaga sp. ARDL2]|uniref:RHS repeat-associated core domain-containing protein n=1 Tax=Capnocytophaga sp. ARDL2 TaxID=3238809 RepID=UPI003558DE02